MKRRKPPRVACGDAAQMMMAGVPPVTLGERLTWAAQQPMSPKRVQRPLDIGFWDPMRDQLELF